MNLPTEELMFQNTRPDLIGWKEKGESGREKEEGARRSLSRTRDTSKTECRDEVEGSGTDSEEETPRKRRRRGK